jgi:hypothetical protein
MGNTRKKQGSEFKETVAMSALRKKGWVANCRAGLASKKGPTSPFARRHAATKADGAVDQALGAPRLGSSDKANPSECHLMHMRNQDRPIASRTRIKSGGSSDRCTSWQHKIVGANSASSTTDQHLCSTYGPARMADTHGHHPPALYRHNLTLLCLSQQDIVWRRYLDPDGWLPVRQ